MTILSWNEQYRIGNPVIDEEHQSLFGLINAFHTEWARDHNPNSVMPILNQLIRYSQQHFQDEEAIMEREQYPLLEPHRKCHEKLVEQIFRLHQLFTDHGAKLEHDLQLFLKHWLVDHVVHNDFEFRDFLAAKHKASRPENSDSGSAVSPTQSA